MTDILVVDDTRKFIKPLRDEDYLMEVEHSWDAIAHIRDMVPDEIWLDFDLHGDDKGSNIARFVRDNKDGLDYSDTLFIIHSANTSGRMSMRDILKDAGITAIMTDLTFFENKKFMTSFGEAEA